MPTLANIVKNIDPPVELTQQEYNSLSENQKNDGTVYFITDGFGPGLTASNISTTDSSNVQAELDRRNVKAAYTTNFATNKNTLVVNNATTRGALFIFGVGGSAIESGTIALIVSWHFQNNQVFSKVLTGTVSPTVTLDTTNNQVKIKLGTGYCVTAILAAYDENMTITSEMT